jgi:hypothetical protein
MGERVLKIVWTTDSPSYAIHHGVCQGEIPLQGPANYFPWLFGTFTSSESSASLSEPSFAV